MSQMRDALHARHYSPRTEKAYCSWARRYIYFHGGQHPAELDERHINEFLTHLAVTDKVSVSTQTQALSALLFLYRTVLGRQVGELGTIIRAHKQKDRKSVV